MAIPELYNNPDRIRLLEQANQQLSQENIILNDRNARTTAAYEGVQAQLQATQIQLNDAQGERDAQKRKKQALKQENQVLRQENQTLKNRVVVLEAKDAERDIRDAERAARDAERAARDAARDARDVERDAQIAFLMAQVNPPAPQRPVLLVPNNEPAPVLVPAPPPVAVQMQRPAPIPPAIQQLDEDPPIGELDELDPDFDDLPSPPRAAPLLPAPAIVDNVQVLALVQQWCTAVDKYLKDHGFMPLPPLWRPKGIVIDQEELAYQALAQVQNTLQKVIEFQEQPRITKYTSRYKEPSDITWVRCNVLDLVPLSDRLCNHLPLMMAAMKITGWAFSKAGPDVRNQREAALVAICMTPRVFAKMNLELRDDIDLARFALLGIPSEADRFCLERLGLDPFARQKFWPGFNLSSPWTRPASLADVSDRLKDLKSFVFDVVRDDPLQIMFAGNRCKNDEEIGTTAVKKYAYALRFIPGLQDNLNVVMNTAAAAGKAVREKGDDRGLEYASSQLQRHPRVIAAFNRAKHGGDCVIL